MANEEIKKDGREPSYLHGHIFSKFIPINFSQFHNLNRHYKICIYFFVYKRLTKAHSKNVRQLVFSTSFFFLYFAPYKIYKYVKRRINGC